MSAALRIAIAGLAAYMIARAVSAHAPSWSNAARYGLAAAVGIAAYFAYPTVVEGTPIADGGPWAGLAAAVGNCQECSR